MINEQKLIRRTIVSMGIIITKLGLKSAAKRMKILTTCPKERIRKPLVCMKSVRVRPSTGESSNEPKSAT